MPDPYAHAPEPDRRDAERLSLAWNALVGGDAGAIEILEPGDAAVIRRLGALAPAPHPRRVFVEQLKEQLMDATLAVPSNGVARRESALSILRPLPVATAGHGRRWWDGARRGLGAAATAALVVATLIGSYLAISSPDPGGDRSRDLAGTGADGTPDASPVPCADCAAYGGSGMNVRGLGLAFFPVGDLSAADLAAREAQLQHWILDPGARVELADATTGVNGLAFDFVLQGVAAVTIDAPAVVNRGRLTRKANVEYPPAGTLVELVPGDTISYPAGRARTIVNPLTTTRLQLKSAVVYAGDVALTRPEDHPSDGRQIRVDGDGVLPQPLADFSAYEVNASLDYVVLYEGTELPTEGYSGTQRIIGPVDSLQASGEGYVLWFGPVLA